MSDDAQLRRKRLAHQSRYRGFLESDILFRRFAERVLPHLDEGQLGRYEALLAEPDQDVYAWVIGTAAVPEQHDHDVMALLRGVRNLSDPRP